MKGDLMEAYFSPRDIVKEVTQAPSQWFQKKVVPKSSDESIEETKSYSDEWKSINAQPIQEGSLAYIHIPFCMNHCVFCGFYKNLWKEDRGEGYVNRLIEELRRDAENRPQGGEIQAVYFGGGTPTALSADDLSRLILAAKQYLPLSSTCEITIEGRITYFTEDKIESAIRAGANRFSIGVQSFDTELRQKLGRHHSGEDAFRYMQHLASYDEAAVVLDLIYGLPSQSDEVWMNDIETALEIGLDGLDIYSFKCFPSLPINRMIEKGKFELIEDDVLPQRHYAYAVNRLKSKGLTQISNSHFAATDKERNIYNSQLKFGKPYLAFGSGAGGYHAGHLYSIESDLATYLNTPISEKPLGSLKKVPEIKPLRDEVKGGIDIGYIDQSLFSVTEEISTLFSGWEREGLIESLEMSKIPLTIAGRFWSSAISRTLLKHI